MPPRSKSLVVLAFVLLAVYLLFWHDDTPLEYGQAKPPSADILKGYLQDLEVAEQAEAAKHAADQPSKGYIDLSDGFQEPPKPAAPWESIPEPTQYNDWMESNTKSAELEVATKEAGVETTWDSTPEPTQYDYWMESNTKSAELEVATKEAEADTTWDPAPEPTKYDYWMESNTKSAELEVATIEPVAETNRLSLQEQFEKESAALAQKDTAGLIYGTTLDNLVYSGAHEGFAAAALVSTDIPLPYSETPPYKYDVYPDYNSKVWKAANKGAYKPCNAPEGVLEDMLVFSGRPRSLGEPPMGSYTALDIDSNLCFERETRLGPYGFQEDVSVDSGSSLKRSRKGTDWDSINWGSLQQECALRNADRYDRIQGYPTIGNYSVGPSSNSSARYNSAGKIRRLDTVPPEDSQDSGKESSAVTIEGKPRTAIIIRTHSDQTYTENDKQNIRALISELSLRSGGEYQVYLLVQVKNESLPIWTDATAYKEVVQDSVPKEFWNMTVLWNDAKMQETYPNIPPQINNVHQSQWLSVQKFAQDYPDFEYYWNWEFDTRYTGQYYNLVEKLATFGKLQPRKYLWERNERYYIPAFHGPYSHFRKMVEPETDRDTVWGPPPNTKIGPVGPKRPDIDPKEDKYNWGVGEDADYISLAPMFNPVLTKWVGKTDVWGFLGRENTPRRATIGTTSRCSKLLLDVMHEENLKGNHASSEMTPQTVALLHGLKAVYAPIPIFFDRAWDGKSLAKYFNPGPKGESGSAVESPYSWGKEGRFSGSTWYYRATPPMRLYNNWLGWEDSGIGGPEWEKTHGRICLPPMMLHPIKDVVKPPPGSSSRSELPY